MRGCHASAGSRADVFAKQANKIQHRHGGIARGFVTTTGFHGPELPFVALGLQRQNNYHAQAHHSDSLRPTCAVQSTSSSPGPLSADEEAAYQEFLQQRKAERKAWKQEVRRRAKFDPMAAPKQAHQHHVSGAGGAAAAGAAATTATAAPTAPKPAATAAPTAPLQALSRPKAPGTASPPGRLPQPRGGAADGSSVNSPTGAVGVAAAAAGVSSPATPAGAGIVDLAAARDKQKAAAVHSRKSYDEEMYDVDEDEPDDEDGGLDLGGMAAMARKVLEDDDEEAVATAVPVASSSGRGGAKAAAAAPVASSGAAAQRRPGAPAPKRQLMPIAALQRQRAAAAAAATTTAVAAAATVTRTSTVADSPAAAPAPAQSAAGGPAAAAGQGQAGSGPAAGPGEAEDDLDWDALQAYEKYEQYVKEVAEEEQRAARASARRAASASASASTSAAAGPAPKAKSMAGRAKAASPAPAPAAAGPAAAAVGAATGRKRRDGAAAAAPSVDPTDKLEQQLDQWEQLVNFFELVERDSKRSEARKQRRLQEAGEKAAEPAAKAGKEVGKKKGGAGAAAAAAGAAAVGGLSLAAALDELGLSGARHDSEDDDEESQGEVEVDWQSLEKLFLGEGWEAELAELKAKVDADAAAEHEGAAAEGEGEEEVESWRDEVSTLLLGLVEISAKRYLGRSLLTRTVQPSATGAGPQESSSSAAAAAAATTTEAAVGEEERAQVFWESPFLLMVQDDSEDPQLEYANRSALAALRIDSFDEATAGLSLAALVDRTDPRSQQEWLWACTEAAERPERYATIPSLRLRGPGPGAPAVLATDVTVFRVDSLEEQPIGQAVVAASWKPLGPGEEGAAGKGPPTTP